MAAFTVTLDAPSATPVTVDYATASGSATAGSDFTAASGTLTFAPGQTTRTILVPTLNDAVAEPTETFTVNLSNPVGATIADGTGVGTITDDDATKFFVVNDGSPDRTYRYGAPGNALGNSALNSGNTAPRGAASTAAGTTVWVVDANKNVYVYNAAGALLGSWTAGGLSGQRPGRRHRHQRHRRLAPRRQGRQGLQVHRRRQPPLRQPERRQQLQPRRRQRQQHGGSSPTAPPSGWWTTAAAPTRCSSTPSRASCWAAGRSTRPTPTRPGSRSTRPTSATSGSSITAPTRSTSTPARPSRTSGSQNASATFALAAGNTNPQDIADPPPAPPILPRPAAGTASKHHRHAARPRPGPRPLAGAGGVRLRPDRRHAPTASTSGPDG